MINHFETLYLSRIYCRDCDRIITRQHCQTTKPKMGQVFFCPRCGQQGKQVIQYWRTHTIDDAAEKKRWLSCTPYRHATVPLVAVGTITVSQYGRRT
ncbi:hypothetical protein [Laceyella putida]|uniref:Uncharacterized protein n=1 Tax=Laceyella putida TaxID=110101 RepID=A0ABW2RIJ7_9BACL